MADDGGAASAAAAVFAAAPFVEVSDVLGLALALYSLAVGFTHLIRFVCFLGIACNQLYGSLSEGMN